MTSTDTLKPKKKRGRPPGKAKRSANSTPHICDARDQTEKLISQIKENDRIKEQQNKSNLIGASLAVMALMTILGLLLLLTSCTLNISSQHSGGPAQNALDTETTRVDGDAAIPLDKEAK